MPREPFPLAGGFAGCRSLLDFPPLRDDPFARQSIRDGSPFRRGALGDSQVLPLRWQTMTESVFFAGKGSVPAVLSQTLQPRDCRRDVDDPRCWCRETPPAATTLLSDFPLPSVIGFLAILSPVKLCCSCKCESLFLFWRRGPSRQVFLPRVAPLLSGTLSGF